MTNDTKTADLPLPLRTRNALEKHGLVTWGMVKAAKLDELQGLGTKSLDAVDTLKRADDEEEPQEEPQTPEESIARGQRRHEVTEKLNLAMQQRLDDTADYAMRGGLERMERQERQERVDRLYYRDRGLEEIQRRGESFRHAGGSVEVSSGHALLALRLEDDLQARIRALISTIKGLPHVKELGVEVDEKVVARMALIRGLESLEKTNGQPAAPRPTEAKASQEDAPVVPTMQDGERYATPDGWNKQSPGEAVPASQVDVHSYYTAYGWERYWGKVDSTTFYFYWCPEKLNQDVAPFPSADKGGRKITVQTTPWGPGHILPAGWNT